MKRIEITVSDQLAPDLIKALATTAFQDLNITTLPDEVVTRRRRPIPVTPGQGGASVRFAEGGGSLSLSHGTGGGDDGGGNDGNSD